MAATPYTPVTQRLKERILEDEKEWKIQQIKSSFDMFRKAIQDPATQVGQAGQAHTTQSTPEWNSAFASTGGKMHLQRSPTPDHFFTTTPSLSPSPSPSPSTHSPLYRTPPPPLIQCSTPEWCKDDSPEGGRVYTPGLYDEDREDEIPDIATLRVTNNEEEENVFRTPPPNHTHTGPYCCLLSSPLPPPAILFKNTQTQTQPTTQTPRQSSSEKRHKKMLEIANNIEPESVACAWMFMGIQVRKSHVAETLRTGFNLKPSLKEVLQIQSEIETEFNKAMRGLINHGSYNRGSGSNLCFINFMRDMMEIPELAMIRMRRVLAECKCCAHHQSGRPVCQEKKRQPDYDMFAQPENDCKCTCRHFTRKLEEALLGEHPLEVQGQLWERSL